MFRLRRARCGVAFLKKEWTMSKEYYRKRLVDLRAKVAQEREAKKRHNEYYASLIRGASSPSTKANYRKSKISYAASHDRKIESLRREIASTQQSLRNCKS